MQKRWMAGGMAAALLLGTAVGAGAATEVRRQIEVIYRGIQIKVDGKLVQGDTEPFVTAAEGRTYVPARALAEALGARVSWDEANSTVVVRTPGAVESSDGVTYTFPYQGASIRLPAGARLAPMEGVLLSAQSSVGMISVVRMENNPLFDLEAVPEFLARGLRKLVPVEVESVARIAVPGADEAVEATASGAGQTVRMRVLVAGSDLWILAVLSPTDQAASPVTAVFDSFQTGR